MDFFLDINSREIGKGRIQDFRLGGARWWIGAPGDETDV